MKYLRMTKNFINMFIVFLVMDVLFGLGGLIVNGVKISLLELCSGLMINGAIIFCFLAFRKILLNVIAEKMFEEENSRLFDYTGNVIFIMAVLSCFDAGVGPLHVMCFSDRFCIDTLAMVMGILGGILKVLAQIFKEALRMQREVVNLEDKVEILQEESKYTI